MKFKEKDWKMLEAISGEDVIEEKIKAIRLFYAEKNSKEEKEQSITTTT